MEYIQNIFNPKPIGTITTNRFKTYLSFDTNIFLKTIVVVCKI